jgi:dihydroxynaphthoic acid synthetase
MEFQDIIYEKHARVRGTARITINRPQVMNAFTGQTLTEMRQAVEDASADPEVGVVVITGAGDRSFCAGGDVRWLQEVQREGAGAPAPVDPHAGIEDCLKPVIARVNGYCIGGGNHMAYFADFTIACEEHAQFGQVGPRVGSPAAGYFVAYLTHVVGAKKAKEIWMLTRRYGAKEALDMGLVNTIVPHEKLDEEVDRWCEELMRKSPSCLKILKASFRTLYEPMREASRRNWVKEIAPEFYKSGEADEGKNAFLQHREPDFARYPR